MIVRTEDVPIPRGFLFTMPVEYETKTSYSAKYN